MGSFFGSCLDGLKFNCEIMTALVTTLKELPKKIKRITILKACVQIRHNRNLPGAFYLNVND